MPARYREDRGIWMVDFWLDVPGRGRVRVREQSPLNTKREALEHERRLREKLLHPKEPEPPTRQPETPRKEATLKEFSDEFLQNWAGIYNRPVEQAQKRRLLRRHILPAMGELRLGEVDARVLAAYTKMKLDAGLHPNTVNHHLACISKMLHAGQEWGYVERLPRLRKLEVPPPDWDFFQPDESERLLVAAREHAAEDHALILMALRTGLRISELLALRWESVDLIAMALRVRRSRSAIATESGPKSKRERSIELSPVLVEALRRHRHLRGPYVFCQADGRPLTRDMANGAIWRACRRASLRRASWRMLRHSFASQLLIAGRSLKEVQELLGHSEMGMTLRYAHLSPTAKREAVAALDQLGHQVGTNAGVGAQEGGGKRT